MAEPRAVPALLALTLAAGCVGVRVTRSAPGPEAAIAAAQALLDHGAHAWNAGDLDGFLSDYATDATFVTPTRVIHGRDAIRGVYARRFGPGAQRDSLRFEGLEVAAVGPDDLHAIAFYVLVRGDSVTARGPTSLALRRIGGRWLIVHDHSS